MKSIHTISFTNVPRAISILGLFLAAVPESAFASGGLGAGLAFLFWGAALLLGIPGLLLVVFHRRNKESQVKQAVPAKIISSLLFIIGIAPLGVAVVASLSVPNFLPLSDLLQIALYFSGPALFLSIIIRYFASKRSNQSSHPIAPRQSGSVEK